MIAYRNLKVGRLEEAGVPRELLLGSFLFPPTYSTSFLFPPRVSLAAIQAFPPEQTYA